MPKLITVCLTQESQDQLEQIRDTHKCPYMRERATAILKVAEGTSGRQVALNGLLKRRKPDTIYGWVKRYQSEGIAGLKVDESLLTGQSTRPKRKPKKPSCTLLEETPLPLANPEVAGV